MSDTTEIGLQPAGDSHVLMARCYALDLIDLMGLLADILRYGGYGLRQDIADRYTPRTVDLLTRELDEHTALLRVATHSTRDIK